MSRPVGTPPAKRTVTSRSLETTLDGGLGEIREAEFTGSVRLRQSDGGDGRQRRHHALPRSDRAGGADGRAGGEIPRVVNDQIAVDAARVEMTIEGSKMKATGGTAPVRTVMYPAKPGAKDARRTPGIMQQDRPVNGSSRELLYTGGESSTAEFTGAVRLWQGDKAETVIQGDKITVDSKTGNLDCPGISAVDDDRAGHQPDDKGSRDGEIDGPGSADGLRRRGAENYLHHRRRAWSERMAI